MSEFDRRSFIARTQALVDASPPTTRAETRVHLVDPLLATLGWTPRAEATTGETVAGTSLEYVYSVGDTPALFVAVDAFSEPLRDDRTAAIETAMDRTGVDRALYTNGRTLRLLARSSDGHADRLTIDWSAIPDHESALSALSRATLTARLEDETRTLAARRLALRRDDLAASIVDDLAAVAGDEVEPALEVATDRFLETLVDGLSRPVSSDAVGEGTAVDPEPPVDRAPETANASEPKRDVDSKSDRSSEKTPRNDDAEEPTSESEPTTAVGRPAESEGEFVVRFFGDRGSVGAIGHSTATGALVHAAEFLLERGLSGVELPWEIEGKVVLAGESLEGPCRQLSNGWYLNTAGDQGVLAERVEEVASRAGLRAMLTGDWK